MKKAHRIAAKIAKAITQSDIWIKSPEYTKAWVWLMIESQHPDRHEYKGKIHVKEGQVLASWKQIADALKWKKGAGFVTPSKTAIEMLLRTLKRMEMVTWEVTQYGMLITLINYRSWNGGPEESDGFFDGSNDGEWDEGSDEGSDGQSLSLSLNSFSNSVSKDMPVLRDIQSFYREKISDKGTRLTEKAKGKIRTRLKEFSVEQIKEAITNFSNDKWNMKESNGPNSVRGIAWFCRSEDHMQRYIDMGTPQKKAQEYYAPKVETPTEARAFEDEFKSTHGVPILGSYPSYLVHPPELVEPAKLLAVKHGIEITCEPM